MDVITLTWFAEAALPSPCKGFARLFKIGFGVHPTGGRVNRGKPEKLFSSY